MLFDKTEVLQGDCVEAMDALIEKGVQVDSIVTDPPYGLKFMGKDWDKDIAFQVRVWERCLKLLKPGGHLLAFSGSRTYHRMVVAIEDAGFEIRDQIMWLYGTGFPKSLDVSKAIDKAAGANRKVHGAVASPIGDGTVYGIGHSGRLTSNDPVTDAARQWQGWGTALKPAHEPIVLARKPLAEKTVAKNVLEHGTGALNIDASRVGTDIGGWRGAATGGGNVPVISGKRGEARPTIGRFPANVIHDGSDEVLDEFTKYGESKSTGGKTKGVGSKKDPSCYAFGDRLGANAGGLGDTGTAARFFYSAKASKKDRAGSKHPTVKPIALIKYLATLITPPDGVCLDPFAGSGTLGVAWPRSILIEKEDEYIKDIERRLECGQANRK